MKNPMNLKPMDHSIRYCPLHLVRYLTDLPDYPLPEGFRFTFYQHNDEQDWISIEQSAGEFSSLAGGRKAWNTYFEPWRSLLPERMLFIETADGRKAATGSAWFNTHTGDLSDGRMHWVACRKEFQGCGLSKPLIAEVLKTLKQLGYEKVTVSTETTAWLACRIYMDFGFRPTEESLISEKDGWRIIRRLTDHPCLSAIEPAEEDELFVQ